MTRKSVHFIGIGGVGMAGLAVLLKARGDEVSGCDLAASPRTRWLEGLGIKVFLGHDPAHLSGVDEVIVTPAVDRNNPELLACKVSVRYRGEVLAELVNASDAIAVCGSHGKTTTSTWIAKLLLALGEDVAWCIGGETGSFPVAGVGKGPLVVEADESDGTLALYRAKTLVVNKCEYDHPDHFKTEADYFACYETAKQQAETVIDAEGLGGLDGLGGLESLDGLGELAPHNKKNARAAIEVALRRGHSLEKIAAVLPSVVSSLPDRRFQQIWPPQPSTFNLQPSTSVTIVTDYAHHPTEMACAVQMARQRCKGMLRVLFQPHRYSRTKALLKDFPKAFDGADEVILCPTYAAFEQPVEGGDVADLYKVCREQGTGNREQVCGCRFFLARSCEEAWEHARNSMTSGDLTLLLGAGDIINLVPIVRRDCERKFERGRRNAQHCGGSRGESSVAGPKRIWIGQGSNTWKSDLNLSVEYVRTTGPADKPGASLGIPWMAGIPGTIGGWIKMNAGAFGHSISEVIDEVKVDGQWLPAAACGFSYRHSDITGEIQDCRFKKGEAYPPSEASSEGGAMRGASSPLVRNETSTSYLAKRKKFPAGTYGSFFKNPPGDFAGRLLEEAGAKELRVGGAYVWQEHANVIVRGEGATSSDVLALARLMRNRVLFRFGIALEPEVCGVTL